MPALIWFLPCSFWNAFGHKKILWVFHWGALCFLRFCLLGGVSFAMHCVAKSATHPLAFFQCCWVALLNLRQGAWPRAKMAPPLLPVGWAWCTEGPRRLRKRPTGLIARGTYVSEAAAHKLLVRCTGRRTPVTNALLRIAIQYVLFFYVALAVRAATRLLLFGINSGAASAQRSRATVLPRMSQTDPSSEALN